VVFIYSVLSFQASKSFPQNATNESISGEQIGGIAPQNVIYKQMPQEFAPLIVPVSPASDVLPPGSLPQNAILEPMVMMQAAESVPPNASHEQASDQNVSIMPSPVCLCSRLIPFSANIRFRAVRCTLPLPRRRRMIRWGETTMSWGVTTRNEVD
jgi:hypothetical protein